MSNPSIEWVKVWMNHSSWITMRKERTQNSKNSCDIKTLRFHIENHIHSTSLLRSEKVLYKLYKKNRQNKMSYPVNQLGVNFFSSLNRLVRLSTNPSAYFNGIEVAAFKTAVFANNTIKNQTKLHTFSTTRTDQLNQFYKYINSRRASTSQSCVNINKRFPKLQKLLPIVAEYAVYSSNLQEAENMPEIAQSSLESGPGVVYKTVILAMNNRMIRLN